MLSERGLLTYVGKVLSILAEEFWENGLSLKPFLILKDVAIHEAIHHGGVGVDVNIKLQACFLLREKKTNDKLEATELALKGLKVYVLEHVFSLSLSTSLSLTHTESLFLSHTHIFTCLFHTQTYPPTHTISFQSSPKYQLHSICLVKISFSL